MLLTLFAFVRQDSLPSQESKMSYAFQHSRLIIDENDGILSRDNEMKASRVRS